MNIEIFNKDWLDENDYDLTDELFRVFNLVDEREWSKTETVGIAYVDGEIAGVILTDGYEVCNIIQVRDEYQRQGIASALVEKTKAYYPRQNGCPEFWDKFSTEQLIACGTVAN